MKNDAALYRLPEAARLLGVSVPTLKQWIYSRKIRSMTTPGGHHRIPASEVRRLSQPRASATAPRGRSDPLEAISGRNKLQGTIVKVRVEGLLAQVTLDIGGQILTAIITRDACRALDLRPGVQAYGLIKATEVMVIRP